MEKQHAELMYVYKKEPKAKERMLAVLNVVAEGETISTIAKLFRKSYNSIKNWVMRFKEFGIAGLYEKPRSGRPTKIVNHKITEFFASVKNGIFPKQIVRQIKKDTGVLYTESGIRDILHRHNFTPKVPDATHKNKATNEEVEEWQKSLKRWISCVKRDNFELHVIDETILLHDYVPKRGPWSPKGQKVLRTYFGDHQRRVIYGAISDSHQYFLQKKKTVRRFSSLSKNCYIVMDGASQHKISRDLHVLQNPDTLILHVSPKYIASKGTRYEKKQQYREEEEKIECKAARILSAGGSRASTRNEEVEEWLS